MTTKNYSSYTDEELCGKIHAGGRVAEESFTELYNRYSSRIHAYCYRILSDRESAEDIFQETFVRLFQKAQSGDAITNAPGLLITIARNLCLNHKRGRKETVPIEDVEPFFGASPNYESKELLDMITRSLDLLDPEFREAFVLREYGGYSFGDIAELTGTTTANAKSRAFRAKQKIKEILLPYLKDICRF